MSLPFRFSLLLIFGAGLVGELSAEKMAPIWTLSDENSTVFLAGSVHLLREKDMPIPEAFERVYEQSDELVFEIDLSEMAAPGMAAKMREIGSLPPGEHLSDKLSPETMKGLRDYLEGMNLSANAFDRLTPGMVYISMGSMEAMRHGARPELGLETLFYRKSVNDNKPSRGLETIEFQITRFDEIDPETVGQLIRETLDEVGKTAESLDEIVAAWKSGDEKQIEELVVDRLAETPDVKKVLLTERNANWIPEIEKALAKDRNVLFLVGAAHLAGEGSVIDFLRKKNHQVIQVSAK